MQEFKIGDRVKVPSQSSSMIRTIVHIRESLIHPYVLDRGVGRYANYYAAHELQRVTEGGDMNPRTKRGRYLNDEQFVRAYMAASNLRELADSLGLQPQSVYVRATRMRKEGIKLPKIFGHRPEGRVDAMNKLISSLTQDHSGRAPVVATKSRPSGVSDERLREVVAHIKSSRTHAAAAKKAKLGVNTLYTYRMYARKRGLL